MLIPIETKRLILRPLELVDVDALFLLDSNADVMRYVGMEPLTERSESEKVLEMIRNQYQTNNIGRFAVIEKESNRMIGWCGLKLYKDKINNHENFYEIGYRFLPEFWGKGYATEANLPFIKRAFEEMNIENLYAYAHIDNEASHHVLRKLGFKENGHFEEPDGTCIWFEISKEDYFK